MENLVGRSLAHFSVESVLGEGGMGVVYRAKDDNLQRDVALKVLSASFASDTERRGRFLREARSAAAVAHANIAAVYEIGEAAGHVFIAMELVEGETLRARIERGIGIAEAVAVAKDIARGMGRAHEKGIVHRDLKPENVMITPRGEAKILDFGLAKVREVGDAHASALGNAKTEEHLTEDGRVLGTPAYMSPEQVRGETADARSDVFSFGILFFEMLTGERPFDGATTVAVMMAASQDAPKRASDLIAGVPPALDRVVARCLEKSKEARFSDGLEVLSALEAASSSPHVSGAGVAVRSSSGSPRGSSSFGTTNGRRAGWLWGALGLALLAGGVVMVRHQAASVGVAATSSGVSPLVASASASAAPVVTRMSDLPIPATHVPAAATEYASGIQAMRDDNWVSAAAHFTKAAELDPTRGMMHLRLAMVSLADTPTRRAEFEKAVALRAQLGERDLALMEALQPYLQGAVRDVAETDRRLKALAERTPGDVEVWMWLAAIHEGSPEALAPAERALALDPRDAQSWESKGKALLGKGNVEEARAAFERCGEISPAGADCFVSLSKADASAGRCADMARDSHRAADRNSFYLVLAISAAASTGATAETLEESIQQFVTFVPEAMGPAHWRAYLKAQLAILEGDFTRARVLVDEESRLLAASATLSSSYPWRYSVASQQIDVALETGDDVSARRFADDFVKRSGAWVTDGNSLDASLYFARLAFPTTEPAPPELEPKRRQWIDSRLALGAYRGELWTYAYAAPALTPIEARAALAAVPDFAPLSTFGGAVYGGPIIGGSPEVYVGRVYLLADQTDEAIVHLRRAVATCDIFDTPLGHVRAARNLGQALEKKGDSAGACEAYAKVLAQWGKAKPRSVTAEQARERVKALACAR